MRLCRPARTIKRRSCRRNLPMNSMQHSIPPGPGHREVSLDAFRGLALLGILLVNIRGHLLIPGSTRDRVLAVMVHAVALNKSQASFALAFGASLAYRFSTATWRPRRIPWKRLAVL